ncbi:MAG: histidine phosphatase family protein, partial [Burkholderiales bacterium]
MEDAQATRVLAIRHGETAWNVDGRIQGQLDVPLNDTGRWQVHRLALAVADEGISAIYSSDLLRALE